MSKLLVAVCSTLRVNNISTNEYYSYTSCETVFFNFILVPRFCHYVSDHETAWDPYLLSTTYTSNVQTDGSMNLSSISLSVTGSVLGQATVVAKHATLPLDNEAASRMYASLELTRRTTNLQQNNETFAAAAMRLQKEQCPMSPFGRIFYVGT